MDKPCSKICILLAIFLVIVAGFFIWKIYYLENGFFPEEKEACKNQCGDGACQEIVCLAIGCPCAETKESCPKDCKAEDETANWQTYRSEEYGFEFKYPSDFFYQEPQATTTACDYSGFPQVCPNINTAVERLIGYASDEQLKIIRENLANPDYWSIKGEKSNINNIPFCLHERVGAAAGSTYIDYYYTTVRNGKCFNLYLLERLTNCGVYGEPGNANYENCNNYNEVIEPKIFEKILSTFRFVD